MELAEQNGASLFIHCFVYVILFSDLDLLFLLKFPKILKPLSSRISRSDASVPVVLFIGRSDLRFRESVATIKESNVDSSSSILKRRNLKYFFSVIEDSLLSR